MIQKQNVLIYGCYGYTGKLISEHAVKQGLKPVLAGRDEAKVKSLANDLKLDYLVFDLTDAASVAERLMPFKIVLHCAGPFKFTSEIMARACLQAKTSYLDITGEFQVFENIFKLDDKAKEAGILMMPGVGFDVVPSDCLSAYLKDVLPTADTLQLALLQKGGRISHGTAITVAESMGDGCMVRRKGKLKHIKAGSLTRAIHVDDREREFVAIPWGDISTAFRSTKIPNITVYNYVPSKVIESMKLSNYIGFILKSSLVKNYIIRKIKKRPAGPDATERANAKTFIWGEVKNGFGVEKRALMELPEGYTITYLAAVEITKRLLNGLPATGAKTPAQVFGKDFILQFEGVSITDLKV
ncbi:MAG: saccharopine dehydrogenase NADP-binding domain-containing protein [Bacteroidetes bacterium]|nr:saccharopine dehydrogenase NADP-binding domain-containing protein [Bacteroidota bacterium]